MDIYIENVKPWLRPMNSITRKEREVIDWLTYTAMVWSRDEFLWESIVKIGYLTPDRYRLERWVKDWFEKHKDGTVTL